METAALLAPAKIPMIVAAARAAAAALCTKSLENVARFGGSAELRARARRYQKAEFRECGKVSARTTRIVFELFDRDAWASREELLEAIEVYCDAGISEVERRFDLAFAA